MLIQLARRLTPLAGATIVSLLNSIGITVLYARLGGARALGTYQLAISIVGALAVLALSGATTAATRAAAQGRRAAWPLFRARLPYLLATAAIVAGAGGVVAEIGSRSLGAALAVAGLVTPLYLGADVYPAELLGAGRFRAYFFFQLAVQGLTLAAVAVTLVIVPHRPWTAVLALAGTTGILQFAGLFASRQENTLGSEDLRYARGLTGVTILSAVDARLDIVLTGIFLGTRQTGLLATARTFPGLVRRAWDVLYPVFFNRLSAIRAEEALAVANRYRVAVLVALGAPSVLGIVLAPTLVPWLFGGGFRGAILVTQLLLVSSAVAPLAFLEAVLLKAQGDLRRLGFSYVALPVVSLTAMPPLIWGFGLKGVGIEAIIAAAVSVPLYFHLARRSVAEAGSRA